MTQSRYVTSKCDFHRGSTESHRLRVYHNCGFILYQCVGRLATQGFTNAHAAPARMETMPIKTAVSSIWVVKFTAIRVGTKVVIDGGAAKEH